MSQQLSALLTALSTGAQEIFKAIVEDAILCEEGHKHYDPYEPLGFDQLQYSTNTDIKHYLHTVAELGGSGYDDQLWGQISVAVLRDCCVCPTILDSQIAVNREGDV